MKLYREGDASQGICPICRGLRETEYKTRDVPLSDGSVTVPDVLVAVCVSCDATVGVPAQSTPRIRESVRCARRSLETRLPRHLQDALFLACHSLGAPPLAAGVLLRYYIARARSDEGLSSSLRRLADSDDAQGTATARFSTKLSAELHEALTELLSSTGLTMAEVTRALVVKIKEDVLDAKDPDRIRELHNIILAA